MVPVLVFVIAEPVSGLIIAVASHHGYKNKKTVPGTTNTRTTRTHPVLVIRVPLQRRKTDAEKEAAMNLAAVLPGVTFEI